MSHGLRRWLSGEESGCRCRRHRFHPWVGKIPGEGNGNPTLVFLPGKSHEQRSLAGYIHGVSESDTTEELSIVCPIQNYSS